MIPFSNKKITILLAIFFSCSTLLFRCQSDKSKSSNENLTIIPANPAHAESIHFSEIIDSITYIPLTAPTQFNMLAESTNLTVKNNRLYVYQDAAVYENVYVFSEDGQYQQHINFTGEGIGKVVNGSGHFVNDDNTIEVLDSYQGKLVKFDLSNGKHLNSKPVNQSFDTYTKSGNKYFFFLGNESPSDIPEADYNLHVTDDAFTVRQKLIPIPDYLRNYRIKDNNFSNEHNGSILLKHFLSNKFYEIKEGSITSTYSVDFRDTWVNDIVLDKLSIDNSRPARRNLLYDNSDHIFHIFNLAQNKNYLFFNFRHAEKHHWAIYNKQTRTTRLFDKRINDFDFGILGEFRYYPLAAFNEGFAFLLPQEALKYDLSELKSLKTSSEINKMRENPNFVRYEKMVNELPPFTEAVLAVLYLKEK